jgi:hypothetical protein
MFPEHLIPRSATAASPASASAFPRSRFAPAPPPPPMTYPSFSFDVLKSDPSGSALEHIASSRPGPARRRPVVRTHPYNANSRAHSIPGSSDGDSEPEAIKEGECGDGEGGAQEGKKHVCTKCAKRFNRPSSLRIHFNMHTGAMREWLLCCLFVFLFLFWCIVFYSPIYIPLWHRLIQPVPRSLMPRRRNAVHRAPSPNCLLLDLQQKKF